MLPKLLWALAIALIGGLVAYRLAMGLAAYLIRLSERNTTIQPRESKEALEFNAKLARKRLSQATGVRS